MIVRVLKTDGHVEEYFHTKVLLCVTSALSAAGEWDVDTAQKLTEAVTAFVYAMESSQISSTEILSMVKVVLEGTGYGDAAAMLAEHHVRRSLARRRTEVVEAELNVIGDAHAFRLAAANVRQWSKWRVARHIAEEYGLGEQAARAAAARVEERVLAMGLTRVWSGLVRQIAMAEAALTITADDHLRQLDVQRRTDRLAAIA